LNEDNYSVIIVKSACKLIRDPRKVLEAYKRPPHSRLSPLSLLRSRRETLKSRE
jgi:hypothetical protein